MSTLRALIHLDPEKCFMSIHPPTAAESLDQQLLEHIQVFRLPEGFGKGGSGHAPLLPGISSGKELLEWYLGCVTHTDTEVQHILTRTQYRFLTALSTLGTLGAGFTLSVVVNSTNTSNAAGFAPKTVTTWAAVSSILFVLTVLVCQGCTQLFKFQNKFIVRGIDHDDHLIKHSLAALSLLLETQVLGAFLFLELVLTAHAPVVGWNGVAITSILAVLALYLWGLQVMRWWPAKR